MKRSLYPVISAIFLLNLCGCNNQVLNNSITAYNKAAAECIPNIRAYYQNLNDFERDVYYSNLRFTSGMKMGMVDNDQPTGWIKRFADEDIEVRLLALQALSDYSEQLALLQGNDAPERSKEAIEQIGKNIGSTYDRIQGFNGKTKSIKVSDYSQPISKIVAIASQITLNALKRRDLKKSIVDSKTEVDQVYTLIENDLDMLYEGSTSISSMLKVNQFRTYYNENLAEGKPTDATRNAFLNESKQVTSTWAHIESANPTPAVRSLHRTFDHLVECAKNNCKSQDATKQLLSDLQQLLYQVRAISDEINQLKRIRESKA